MAKRYYYSNDDNSCDDYSSDESCHETSRKNVCKKCRKPVCKSCGKTSCKKVKAETTCKSCKKERENKRCENECCQGKKDGKCVFVTIN